MSGRLRVLTLIPAHNEAASLPAVVSNLRRHQPDLDIMVVDDGSSDGTAAVLEDLNVRWLGWPERRGIGCSIRTGLRYAIRLGFDVVVRLDADGQHDVRDVERLLAVLDCGKADVVLGSRYVLDAEIAREPRLLKRALAILLSAITRKVVTDPTSGFWALGPRAVSLLAEHHPRGYPEPELHLFLSRNALRVVEVQVRSCARLNGQSSLTPGRVAAAGARVLLAMLIVPFRVTVGAGRD